MPAITYTNTIFTGIGLKNLSGQKVSFQWFGFASAPSDGSVPTTLNSILNGSMKISEETPVQTAPTTAYNGFVDAWNECTTITGTVEGYLQPASIQPTVSGAILPTSNGLYYFKALIGTLYYAGFGYFSGFEHATTADDAAHITFNFTMTGIPTAATFDYVRGGAAPPTT